MSAVLITYLNYIMTWDGASDAEITSLITEQEMFVNLGTFNADAAVESEFADLISEATKVRNLNIAEDALEMAADAAAIASIWTFGFVLVPSLHSRLPPDLNKKFGTIDDDIAAKISPQVNAYIQKYKANNDLIVANAPVGVDTKECRGYLMQFMAQVQRHSADKQTFGIAGFRTWTDSATQLFNASEISQVYAALDELNLSAKTTADAQKCLVVIGGLGLPVTLMKLAQALSVWVMVSKLNVARENIREAAENLDPEETRDTWEIEETEPNAFDAMDAMGKFAAGIVIVISVVDIFLKIWNIVDVVEQSQTLCGKLTDTVKPSYKSYFDSLQQSSQMYNAAIANTPTSPSTHPKA
ncbi:hypothetical protein B0T11DRAFT_333102 [Plectosphaerella cucumerina]|uniref:Uncharacterized protein n=1 Tax=Plectosphaerella cucumerina TaxID=40658 RepID=A0A8K0T4F6_9PEZI|nr:hypothetical protein B0T11DRAFT_333102 [Plectosphaerella cucumerina]